MRYVLHIISFLLAGFGPVFCLAQNVGIGTSSPDGSALLELNSSNRGILIPRMDNTQMRSIAAPAEGLMVYNSTDSSFYTYKSRWRKMSITLPYRDTVNTTGITGLYVVQEGSGDGIKSFNRNNGNGIVGLVQDMNGNPGGSSTGVIGANFNTNGYGVGVYGQHSGGGINAKGVHGIVFGTAGGIGVQGEAHINGVGVKGIAGDDGYGVQGFATGAFGYGVFGSNLSGTGYGVSGQSSGSGTGVYGYSNTGTAGSFNTSAGIALKTTGAVQLTGIGEGTGKVLVSSSDGTANWGTIIKTESFNIPGAAFRSEISAAGYIATNGEAYSAGTGYQLLLEAPVYLPEGATLAGMTAYVMDNTTAKGITVSLRRLPNTGGVITMASTGTTAADLTGGYFAVAAPLSYTINNSFETYSVEVTTSDATNWPGDLLRIKSVRIVYSYPVNN